MDILGFFAGVLYFYTHSWLILVCLAIFMAFRPTRKFLWCCGFGISFGWVHQWWVSEQGMPDVAVIRHAILSGVIASIPKQNPDKTQFEFDLKDLNHHPVQGHIQLNCYRHCPVLHAGEYWQLSAKLHVAHNLNNPGGFDYKTYLAARHIHWVGYVLPSSMHILNIQPAFWTMLAWREKLAVHLASLFENQASLGIVQALSIGVTNHIDQTSWTLFRRTGTTHLMVISGAHIGLVAGLIFKLVSWLWRQSAYLCLRCPAQKIASIFAMVSSVIYALIAGFGAPAERATLSASLVFFRYLGQRQFSAWQAWRYALLIVLMTEPHAVLLPGFYLSFVAVAILLTMNKRIVSSGIRKGLYMQLACMLGLMPFTLFWFSYGAINGLLANILAIPWVSFVIVPLALVCLIMGHYMPWLPWFLHINIRYLLLFLQWVDSFAWLNTEITYPYIWIALSGMMGLILYLFLPIMALWPLCVTFLVLAIYPYHQPIAQHTFKAQVLDVGQGLSVLIQTQNHALLYDTGGQNYQGSDMGNMVILPYFRHIGLKKLDKIVVSHPDLDHRGGLHSIEKSFPNAELIVDSPAFYHRGQSCHHYPDWTWEGVHFHFFPIRKRFDATNNRSCILKISNLGGEVLLTGDIEKSAEQYLIQHYGSQLHATVLVVPHHGSGTSSSLSFLQTVAPKLAIFSYGFDNRYRFPHAKVIQRYQNLHISMLATAETGLIALDIKDQNKITAIK